MASGRTIRLLSRSGCHLCDEAAEALGPIAAETGAMVEIVDIGGDPALEQEYGLVIPVVLIDEQEIARAPILHDALRRSVLRALGR